MRAEDFLAIIGFYAVVAALVVTVTYSSAVLPPQEFKLCTDLCGDTVAALGIRYAFGACLLEGDRSQTAQSCQVLKSPLKDKANTNNIQWGVVHRPFMLEYIKTMNLSATDHEHVYSFRGFFEAYIFFNSFAMLLSLFCIAVGAAFTASAFTKDVSLGDTTFSHLQDVKVWMQMPLLASLMSLLLSFVCILYYVFWRDGANNTGIILAWILAGLLFAIFVSKAIVFFSSNLRERFAQLMSSRR